MTVRTATRLAWSLWALAIGSLASALAYEAVARSSLFKGGAADIAVVVTILLFVPTFATAGALVASKRPSNPIGWLLCITGICFGIGSAGAFLGRSPGTLALSEWLNSWVWGLGLGLTATFVFLLFPTGTLPSRRWRPVAWIAGGSIAAFVLGNAFAPGLISDAHSVNPVGVGGPVGDAFKALRGAFGLTIAAAIASTLSVAVRYRRADPVERQQLKWLVYAGGLFAVAIVAQSVIQSSLGNTQLGDNLENAVITGALLFVPIAFGVAILKHRLYDIDVVINKTVVFGALAAFITAVYVAIVVGIGAAVGTSGKPNLALSILATAVVAVAFQPVRERVQRLANRVVYGRRASPYEVLSEFSSRMAGTYANEDLLPRMARILAEGTGAKQATVWLHVGSELRPDATWPAEEEPALPVAVANGSLPDLGDVSLSLPVHHHGELLGALSLRKPTGDRLTPAEEKLAADLASQAGLVLRNVRLTEELLERLEQLRASRQRLVAAQDEERRKLERNIHDGAQQQLVALAVKLRLARQLAGKDAAKAADLLTQVEGEITEALEDLRDLARGIYPPLLADKGLAAALEAQARKSSLPVRVQARGVGRYPQEQEAAVYFCVLEALQNVAKYANGSGASISVSEEDGVLTFTVRDDGVGFDPSGRLLGTGLQGMADRLAALDGSLEVRSSPGRGTSVTGHLPVHAGKTAPEPATA